MRRGSLTRGAFFGVAVGAAVFAFGGCEAVLGVGSLTERSDDGGSADGTVGDDTTPDSGDAGVVQIPDGSHDGSADAAREADAASETGTSDSGSGCTIGTMPFTSGEPNPSDPCQVCKPSVSATAWTDAADGTGCGTGDVCSAGACLPGCGVGGMYYAVNSPSQGNSCQTCQPGTSTTAFTNATDGTGCGAGVVCDVGACVAGCGVGGGYYAPNAVDQVTHCQSCQPATSTTAFTSLMDGTGCGNGQTCVGGQCGTECVIGGMAYPSGTKNSANACQSCQPGMSTSAWTNASDGASCGIGEVCDAVTCGAGCFIGQMVYGAGQPNPSTTCQTCRPATSTTSWTDVSDGMGCGTGNVCSGGACGSGCFIGGMLFSPGATESGNACQSCQPAASTTTWTNIQTGFTCGSGEICNAGACVVGCDIGGTVYSSGSVDSTNACQTCNPTSSTTTWTTLGNGATCAGSGSCAGGACILPNCSPGGAGLSDCGSASESCCTSPTVSGGSFYRAYANSGSGPTGEAHAATLSSYRLDKYLVTVGRFRQFVAAWDNGLGFLPSGGSGKHSHLNNGNGLNATAGGYEPGWSTADNPNVAPTNTNLICNASYATWTDSEAGNENLPITCTNWAESYAFCIWDGGFLPSEAESIYAAAGGSQQLEYPWGSTTPGTASKYAIYGCYYPSGSGTCSGVANIAPVGTTTLGAGVWGQLDLSGTVFEREFDWYASTFADPCLDCADVTTTTQRSIRGGFYANPTASLAASFRDSESVSGRDYGTGFRCARAP